MFLCAEFGILGVSIWYFVYTFCEPMLCFSS